MPVSRLVFDCEGNGLLDTVTTIHCLVAIDPDTRQKMRWGPGEIPQALSTLEKADKVIAHYGEGYDFPALEKVHGFVLPEHKREDTVVKSRLFFPNIKEADKALVKIGKLPGKLAGKHSIEAWGHRLGRPKVHVDYEDWAHFTPEMMERCDGDTETNVDLLLYLDGFEYPEGAVELEHKVQRLLFRMQAAGVPFDEAAARKLHVDLLAKREALEEELIAEYGFWYAPCSKKRDEFGLPLTWAPKRDDVRRGYTAGAAMTKVEKVTFNPRSNQHAVKMFKSAGWEPVSFTKGGDPELTDEVLESIAKQYPNARKLADYRLLAKRLDMLSDGDAAWLKKVESDGCIHGSMNPMGTPHSRASHFGPNMAQVPKVQKLYGKECRSLFGAGHKGPEWVQVGADMAGLQLRALGHYLAPIDGGVYGRTVVSSDVHWFHAQAATLVDADVKRDKSNPLHEIIRDTGAKPYGYSYLFGCFPPKSGAVVRNMCIIARQKGYPELYDRFFGKGQSNKVVGEKTRAYFDEYLKLGELNRRLAYNFNLPGKWRHHITGLDGRKVPCRSRHSLLNYLLSSAEAIITKTWIVLIYEEMTKRGWRFGWDGEWVMMLWVHDETQIAVRKGMEEEVGRIVVDCAKRAGEVLGFRVPLASEHKIGRNWAETH